MGAMDATSSEEKRFERFSAENLSGERAAGWGGLTVRALPWRLGEGESDGGWACVKRSNTRCVLRGEWTPEGVARPTVIYAKRYRLRNWRKALLALVYSPKGPREFAILTALMKRGIPAPRPLMWAVEQGGALPRASYLVTETLGEDGQPLKHYFTAQPEMERLRLISSASTFLRHAHDMGFYHDDCSAEHLFLNVPEWRTMPLTDNAGAAVRWRDLFAFLDVDNARLRDGKLGEGPRLKNIVQLWRSFGRREDILTHEMKMKSWLAYWEKVETAEDKHRKARLKRIARRKLGRDIF